MSAFSTNEKLNLDNNNNNNNNDNNNNDNNNNNFISIALLSYVQGALQLCKQHVNNDPLLLNLVNKYVG